MADSNVSNLLMNVLIAYGPVTLGSVLLLCEASSSIRATLLELGAGVLAR